MSVANEATADEATKKGSGPKMMSHPDVKLPSYIGQSITSLLVFIMAATMRADWLIFLVSYQKSQEKLAGITNDSTIGNETADTTTDIFGNESLHQQDLAWNENLKNFVELRFANLMDYCIPAFIISYLFFFGIGGYLHIVYYVQRRDRPEEWKCQPYHWLPKHLEIHEICVGAFSLTIGSFISSAMACWVMNDGWTKIYFDHTEHGYLWLLIQTPLVFIWQDYITYWGHRFFHYPWLYKNFHKLHHTYKQPTAWSATAIHPVEFIFFQCIYISPMFLFTIHYVPFISILLYTYYHGIIDHSGITFKRQWWQPWQPDCIFHDNHHQYFHVNFGFNIELWDKIHGTYRQKDRIYNEDTFFGQGKSIKDANEDELQTDIQERISENPLAYTGNKLHFELTQDDIKMKKAL